MTKEQFSRELDYGISMIIAKKLLKEGLISEKEYRKIDTVFTKKYLPIIGGNKVKKS